MDELKRGKLKDNLIFGIGALGGLLFGYDTGIVAGAGDLYKFSFSMSQWEEGFCTASVVLGSAIMALAVGWLSDKFGRKKLLLASSIIFIGGALASAIAPNFILLCLSRIILGFGVGIASAVVPTYLSELAPAIKRGPIASLFQSMLIFGILLSYISSILLYKGHAGSTVQTYTGLDWRLMLGSAIIPAIILLFGSMFLPESPRFLIKNGQYDLAKSVLTNLRKGFSEQKIIAELTEIEQINKLEAKGKISDLFKIAKPAFIAACGLIIFNQLVGINSILYYGPTVIRQLFNAGLTGNADKDALIIQVFLGAINFLGTILTIVIINKRGNKYWLTLGAIGMGAMLLICTLFDIKVITDPSHGYIIILLIALYLVFFEISWGPIPWNSVGELFPLHIRGIGASIATSCNWFTNFIIMFLFPVLVGKNADGSPTHLYFGFLLFSGFCILACIFVRYFVPETRGKSLEQIEESFTKKAKLK
ncbi:MAG: sugar porter family MFS transporter [Bifidobacteriaceae bacterium]|jgi:sugar porter (SP) family MFS transporter|nr:sugar porter family MFS transporter [Bifidobacteriaceae bacterium]